MTRRLLPSIAVAAILIGGSANAQQQAPCGPHEIIAGALPDKYQESPVARMLSDQGFAIEIFASVDGSTFTVLGVQPSGTTCLLASGTAFSFVSGAASENEKPGANS